MTKAMTDLLATAGLPMWLIAVILLVSILTTLVLALARARASVVRAHGASERTVAVLESRLRHRRWKIAQRDRRRAQPNRLTRT